MYTIMCMISNSKRPRKKGGFGDPPPENLYKWYTNGANLGISGKFDPLFYSLILAYFKGTKCYSLNSANAGLKLRIFIQ